MRPSRVPPCGCLYVTTWVLTASKAISVGMWWTGMTGGGGGSPVRGALAPPPAEDENRQLLLTRIRNYAAEYEQLNNTLAGMRMFFAETDD